MRTILIILLLCSTSAANAAEPSMQQMRILMGNLTKGLNAACSCSPIRISIDQWSKWPDVSGWVVDYDATTTAAQQQAGKVFLATFNPTDPKNQTRH